GDARVARADLVWQRNASRRRPNQKPVLIDEERRLIVIVERAEVERVALGEEIAPVEVRSVHLLPARPPAVETAIGILLQHVEVRDVVLNNVVVQVAEEPRARLFVAEDQPARVAGETLDAYAKAGEIEERLTRAQPLLRVEFLHADVGIGAVRTAPHVDRGQSVFARTGVIDVELGRDADLEIDGLEPRAAAEQRKGEAEVLLHSGLLATSEETVLARVGGARYRRHGDAAAFERGFARSRKGEEQLAPVDRVIALQRVAAVRIQQVRRREYFPTVRDGCCFDAR